MKVVEKPFTIISSVIKDGFKYIEKSRELNVGNKRVITKIQETHYKETPSFYNDGMGGTNVKSTTIDDVFDFLGRYCGSRKVEQHVLTEVNENGHIYTPPKPLIVSKKVTKDCRQNNHSTITTCGYNNGYRNKRVDNNNGKSSIIYYSYSNGLPTK